LLLTSLTDKAEVAKIHLPNAPLSVPKLFSELVEVLNAT
jgi:hypothetical protein